MYAELDEADTALGSREWRFAADRRLGRSHAVLVLRGRGEIRLTQGHLQLSGPAFAWTPAGSAELVRLEAGGSGFVLSTDEDLIARALAGARQPAEARALFDRIVHLDGDGLGGQIAAFRQSCLSIGRELREAEGGWDEVVALHLAILLRLAARLSGARTLAHPTGTDTPILFQRFIHFAELHFREHWSVSRYASELGVTERRLHMACVRATERSPLTLLHQRLAIEARSRLEETALPVAQIGYSLGFRDASQFSRFFRRLIGQTAGAYRGNAKKALPRLDGYAAWP